VVRGIEHRKIPPEALVCQVGTRRWSPLAAIDAFHAAVVRSYPPPPPDSEEARQWLAQGFRFTSLGALPSFDYPLDDPAEEITAPAPKVAPARAEAAAEALPVAPPRVLPGVVALPHAAVPPVPVPAPVRAVSAPVRAAERPLETPTPTAGLRLREAQLDEDWDTADADEIEPEADAIDAAAVDADWIDPEAEEPDADELEVELEAEQAGAIDWREPFEPFFLVEDGVELPDERAILASLASASRETFQDESALWNLALCLAYGSEAIATAAARTFFDSVATEGTGAERIDWMLRALLGSGFVCSGIPREAGARGVRCLHESCPPGMTGMLS
jgi:hypothetical protein